MMMLCFENDYASAESWACLIMPSSGMIIHGHGVIMLQGFTDYDETWKSQLGTKKFENVFQNYIEESEYYPTLHAVVLFLILITKKLFRA